MKAKQPNIKYVEWRSPEELHEISLSWVSELKFIKDEQHFLDELIENHTLQLISKKTFEKSKQIIQELSLCRKNIDPLLKKIINHHNELTILLDGIDQPIKEKQYKEDHWGLTIEVSTYFNNYKEIKRKIFDLIKAIIKQGKQKRLLN
ncbi:hypothetical protein ATE84_0271 [Aquimarina sp. MAR_2010_214]|uniref:hypothetical protein n=1 Tax=Aquimarina sp. MAR_2010_214 TaxID=1250026 RepID=UPI000C70EA6B|nr:hypothetical protein [Aquimarina sp. MAR_2010_214]PKV48275.1 hypothetical protein ATE84_0271 [Aquimarina sp. MAR_2010_214]